MKTQQHKKLSDFYRRRYVDMGAQLRRNNGTPPVANGAEWLRDYSEMRRKYRLHKRRAQMDLKRMVDAGYVSDRDMSRARYILRKHGEGYLCDGCSRPMPPHDREDRVCRYCQEYPFVATVPLAIT